MRRNRAVLLWAPAALVCLQMLSPASAHAGTPTCLGRDATIVGTAGSRTASRTPTATT